MDSEILQKGVEPGALGDEAPQKVNQNVKL